MKQIKTISLITIALLITSYHSFAQHKWSAGYQLGIGNSNLPLSNKTGESIDEMKPMVTNQLFIKRKLSKKLDVEVSFGYTAWKQESVYTVYTNPITEEKYNINNKAFNLTLTAKYTLLQKAKWNLYLPFGINSVHHESTTSYNDALLAYPWMVVKYKETQIGQNVFTGLGTNCDLNKRLYFNGQATIGYKLYNAFSDLKTVSNGYNNVSYGFQAGIGYRF